MIARCCSIASSNWHIRQFAFHVRQIMLVSCNSDIHYQEWESGRLTGCWMDILNSPLTFTRSNSAKFGGYWKLMKAAQWKTRSTPTNDFSIASASQISATNETIGFVSLCPANTKVKTFNNETENEKQKKRIRKGRMHGDVPSQMVVRCASKLQRVYFNEKILLLYLQFSSFAYFPTIDALPYILFYYLYIALTQLVCIWHQIDNTDFLHIVVELL